MSKCGVSIDKESLDVFFKQIEGKDVAEAVTEGKKKHVSMPCGGGGAAVAAPAGGDAPKVEEKKEEKKEEPEDVDMGGLFGDDDDY